MANSTLLQMLEIKAWEPPTDILYPKESRSLVRCCLNLMSSTALFSNLQRITHHIRWIVFITWRGAFHLLWIDQFQRLVALHARPPIDNHFRYFAQEGDLFSHTTTTCVSIFALSSPCWTPLPMTLTFKSRCDYIRFCWLNGRSCSWSAKNQVVAHQ